MTFLLPICLKMNYCIVQVDTSSNKTDRKVNNWP